MGLEGLHELAPCVQRSGSKHACSRSGAAGDKLMCTANHRNLE